MKSLLLFLSLLTCTAAAVDAQVKWYKPLEESKPVVQGVGWAMETKGTFQRFPDRAKAKVRPQVWSLSTQNAGLSLRFYTNAPEIIVRYKTRHKAEGMPQTHLSTTGVDLYTRDCHGKQSWCAPKFRFDDTITFRFGRFTYHNIHKWGNEFELYLPLYNDITWMEIGVPDSSMFKFEVVRPEKPIVAYGTSITQGASPSRVGMAWTNILQRKLDYPLVNLGFSGNAFLEPEVIDLINEIDSKLIILDNIPNLAERADLDTYTLAVNAVRRIRCVHPETPILLVDHPGYPNGEVSDEWKAKYEKPNKAQQKAYEDLRGEGVKNIYYLTKEMIGMSNDGWFEGIHPNDLGMSEYATAYEKIVREILHMPTGKSSTEIACRQRREPHMYEWHERHAQILELCKARNPEIVMVGNSITNYWSGEPKALRVNGPKSWEALFGNHSVVNMGYGWDRIENVLWRVYHGEMDGFEAKHIFLMIGTNNLEYNTDSEIVAGLKMLAQAIAIRQPKAKLHIVGILPRVRMEVRVAEINKSIKAMAQGIGLDFVDAGQGLLLPDGKVNSSLFSDGLHPLDVGYERIAKVLKPIIDK